MINIFADAETNLGRAAWAHVITFLACVAAAFVLGALGVRGELGLVVLPLGLLAIAWFMSQAARAQGRNAVLYGLSGLLPPLSLIALLNLLTRDAEIKLARKLGVGHDA